MIDPLRGEWSSASNALPDRLCRGRHQAQINLPELPRSDSGAAGTVIHALWTGTESPREPGADEIEKAEALSEQEVRVAEEFFPTGDGLVRIVERRLWHEFPAVSDDPAQGTLKTSGQFDVALIHPESRRALICDGKSGWLPVTPNPSNLQLRRLAGLLWLQLDSAEIGVCILKPLGKMEAPCLYTVPDLRRSVSEMEEDVRQSHTANAPRTAGEEQCRYCRAREVCPARLAWLAEALPAVFPPLPLKTARDWTPAQRALFLEREKDARDWLAARKDEIKALLSERAEAVPGYGLKPGRTVETITDPQQVWQRFSQGLGGGLQAFMKCIKVGKSALKDEVRALSGHQGRALEADLDSLLAGCVETTTSAPTIERLK
jgi:Protein of unknown function (DUF2800)